MSYADHEAVSRYTGLTFTAEQEADIDELCADASDFMEDRAGCDNLLDIAQANSLRMLCARLVASLWGAREKMAEYGGVASVKIGDFALTFDKVLDSDAGLSSAMDKLALAAEANQGVEVVDLDLSGV